MNFYRKFDVYDKNALVQKKTAEKLMKIMKENLQNSSFEKVFEIGCGTGIFTKLFLKNFETKKLILNDIFDTRKYFKNIKYDEFILEDMDRGNFPKVSLVVSSSVFQWSKDFENLIKNISNSCETLIFSMYLEGNLYEIKEHFNISLKYFSEEETEKILRKYFKNIKKESEIFIENFNSPLEVLKHLRDTGTTRIGKTTRKKILEFSSKKITYKAGYFLCEK